MKVHYFLLFFLFVQSQLYGQKLKETNNFNHKIVEVSGDLNKDHFADKIIVTQDTLAETAPYRLQIFLAQPDQTYKLQVSTTNLIKPQYPNGRKGFSTGSILADITIKNNILTIGFDLIRGSLHYKFRLQNGNFELIGYTEAQSSGHGRIYYTDFNLSTGIKITKTQNYETDEFISNTKSKILIRPLPKIQDIIPFENDDNLR